MESVLVKAVWKVLTNLHAVVSVPSSYIFMLKVKYFGLFHVLAVLGVGMDTPIFSLVFL